MTVIDITYGSLLVGVVIAGTLYGCICMQSWHYLVNYPSDGWYIMFLVISVLVSETCHQAMITHAVYTYLITNIAHPESLGKIIWSPIVSIFCAVFTTLSVQCFLVYRIHRLNNKNWLPTGSIMVLVVAQFIVAVVYCCKALTLHMLPQLASLSGLAMTVTAIGAAANFLIAAFLCTLLHRSRTGFQKSDSKITKLMIFTINTGLLTSICAIASLICLAASPHTFVYISFYYCTGRLYAISLFATLNARKPMKGDSQNDDVSLYRSTEHQMNRTKFGTSSKRTPNNISIKVDTTREYIRDECSLTGSDVKDAEVECA